MIMIMSIAPIEISNTSIILSVYLCIYTKEEST